MANQNTSVDIGLYNIHIIHYMYINGNTYIFIYVIILLDLKLIIPFLFLDLADFLTE